MINNELKELPEYWCIKSTEENKKILTDYFRRGYDVIVNYYHYVRNNNFQYYNQKFDSTYTEISLEQFKKWVLKKEEVQLTFEIGKWHKFTKEKGFYLKPLNFLNNEFIGNAIGSNKNYYENHKWRSPNRGDYIIITDLSEIQQHLPEGHVDKIETMNTSNLEDFVDFDNIDGISKGDTILLKHTGGAYTHFHPEKDKQYTVLGFTKRNDFIIKNKEFKPSFDSNSYLILLEDKDGQYFTTFGGDYTSYIEKVNNIVKLNEELLKEAKRRYPVGTKFYPAHVNNPQSGKYCIITEDSILEISRNEIISNVNDRWFAGSTEGGISKYGNTLLNRIVYSEGNWAEIVEESKQEAWIPEVGDWAYILGINHTYNNSHFPKGEVFKISKVEADKNNNYYYIYVDKSSTTISGSGTDSTSVRKALPHEIPTDIKKVEYPMTEKECYLPDNWKIYVTKENQNEIRKIANDAGINNYYGFAFDSTSSFYYGFKEGYFYEPNCLEDNLPIITFEQFKAKYDKPKLEAIQTSGRVNKYISGVDSYETTISNQTLGDSIAAFGLAIMASKKQPTNQQSITNQLEFQNPVIINRKKSTNKKLFIINN